MFSKERAWAINDHAHKKGSYYRGFRKRRLFQLMELEHIRGKRVLDVGCGNGQHAVLFAMYGAEVVAFDISAQGVAVGRRMAEANGVLEHCNFVVQTVSEMAFKDDSFDIVIFNAVLHHVLKYPNVKCEALRVLKPGGRIVFAEGLRSNPLYREIRSIYRRFTGGKPQGDIDLEYEDLLQFAADFRETYLECFCLSLGVKELIAKPIDNSLPIRTLLFMLKKLDDIILAAFPSLQKYCSETVGVLTK